MSRAIVITILSIFTCIAVYLGVLLNRNSEAAKKLKADYFTVNQIKYGLLSGNNWTYQVNRIIADKIDSFNIDKSNRRVLRKQIEALLGRMIDETEKVLHEKKSNLKDRIRYRVINTLIDLDEVRAKIPQYSAALVDELSKSKHKEKIKVMLKKKITGILDAANQDTLGEKALMIKRYDRISITDFNIFVAERTEEIASRQKKLGYGVIGVLVATLLFWLIIFRIKRFYALTFLFSVLISFTALFIGVSLPMIEIDARISELNLQILSAHIVFYEQVIFYQAKSILDVIEILLTNGRADTILVGCLIFIFSVLFPVMKLVSTTIYLFRKKPSGMFIHYMAFKSGKWSMADVMVIAIFMAYVGFQSILDNQLEDITVHNDTVNVITTNRTNLQTGFIVFVAFVLFNLILAEILKKITRNRKAIVSD
jgi:hypothetical protein